MSMIQLLSERVQLALAAAIGSPDVDAAVQIATKPQFGDYQVNGVMAAAKRYRLSPRELAERVLEQLDVEGLASRCDIAGPGFINIHLDDAFVARCCDHALADEHLGVALPAPQKLMVEYSSPNLAKEMHVGHLRSTIIGDALARVHAFLGHEVHRANHVGDWGTQFGMLIAYLREQHQSGNATLELNDLEAFYRQAKVRFDESDAFADRARRYVVQLQQGDPEVLGLWQQFVSLSLVHCQQVYDLLGVDLTRADACGESMYNADLPAVVADLQKVGLLQQDDGARVVFLEEFRSAQQQPMGVIIQKKDGGYLYTTTDISAVRYRYRVLGMQRVLYVVDARQSQHFQQLFLICRKAGFVPPSLSLEHIAFGMMLAEDGRPFKTRDGGTVKLIDLLQEAEQRAYERITGKNPDLPEAQKRRIAHAVGIGAVKYADLSKHRTSDYIFNWDNMLAFDGNTAPYLQYAYTRLQSLFRKAPSYETSAPIVITVPAEKQLALALAQFGDVLLSVADNSQPHLLCQHLYHIATLFSRFYQACPVLKSEGAERNTRLQLAALTAKTLRVGLALLGIEALDKM